MKLDSLETEKIHWSKRLNVKAFHTHTHVYIENLKTILVDLFNPKHKKSNTKESTREST